MTEYILWCGLYNGAEAIRQLIWEVEFVLMSESDTGLHISIVIGGMGSPPIYLGAKNNKEVRNHEKGG